MYSSTVAALLEFYSPLSDPVSLVARMQVVEPDTAMHFHGASGLATYILETNDHSVSPAQTHQGLCCLVSLSDQSKFINTGCTTFFMCTPTFPGAYLRLGTIDIEKLEVALNIRVQR